MADTEFSILDPFSAVDLGLADVLVTNDSKDTWFVGFSPDLAVGVFAGFDNPAPLGKKETGSSVAAPIFRDVMAAFLADKPATPFRIPPDIKLVRVDAKTGLRATRASEKVILEAFKPGNEPGVTSAAIGTARPLTDTVGRHEDGSADLNATGEAPVSEAPQTQRTPAPAAPVRTIRRVTDGVY